MSYQRVKSVDFTRTRAGLSTVAWSLDGGTTWSTTGVAETPAGSGIYQSMITFPDAFAGAIVWKTGEGGATERFAVEDVDAAESDSVNGVLGAPVGGGTLLEAFQVLAAILAGRLTQSSDGTTDSFADFKDPDTPRVTSTSTPTQRDVTIH